MSPYTRLLLLALACLSLTACIGAGTVTGRTFIWDAKESKESGLCPIEYEKMIVDCPIKSFPHVTGSEDITPDKLINMWGAPDNLRVEHGRRTLTYRHGLAWRGLVLFLIAPVPLLAPLGHNEASLTFEDKRLIHVEYTDNRLDAAICGLHSEGPDGIGCIADWH
jgi:hypothetical protein